MDYNRKVWGALTLLVVFAMLIGLASPLFAQESSNLYLPIIAVGAVTSEPTPVLDGCEALRPDPDFERDPLPNSCGWHYSGAHVKILTGGDENVVVHTVNPPVYGPFNGQGFSGPLTVWYPPDLSSPKVTATEVIIITPVPTATSTPMPTATATATPTVTLFPVTPTPTSTPVPLKACQSLPSEPQGAWSYLASDPNACGLKLEAMMEVTVSVPISWVVNTSITISGPVTVTTNEASFWRLLPEAEDIQVLSVAPTPVPVPPCENPNYPAPDRWSRIVDENGQPQGCGWQLSPGEEFSLYIPSGYKVVDEGPGFLGPGDHFFPRDKGASLWRLF